LSNQKQILAHFRNHSKSTITCNRISREERVTNIICHWFWLAAKL
jgi:hypothetical protein